eukprot:scaffold12210_cov136-Amphora_coffeaeformis.AAC.1
MMYMDGWMVGKVVLGVDWCVLGCALWYAVVGRHNNSNNSPTSLSVRKVSTRHHRGVRRFGYV